MILIVGPDALRAWLERRSGQHWDRGCTLVLAQYKKGDVIPLAYLAQGARQVMTRQNNGDRLFHTKVAGSVAFIPVPAQNQQKPGIEASVRE